jgi:hypothetical protein
MAAAKTDGVWAIDGSQGNFFLSLKMLHRAAANE